MNDSILQETNFSKFNLRDAYITDYADYAAVIRDEAIFSNFGLKATIKIPLQENNVDEYSNYADDNYVDFSISTEMVVPLFDNYRQNVSVEGMSADGTEGVYPLEVLLPTKLHLPKNSRIVLNEYNSLEYKIAREWVVLSTEMKQLSNSKTYCRVANCIPARQNIQRPIVIGEDSKDGIFYFVISDVINEKVTLRASGCTYFDTTTVTIEVCTLDSEVQENNKLGEVIDEKITTGWDITYEALEPDYVDCIETVSLITKNNKPSANFVIKPAVISVLY